MPHQVQESINILKANLQLSLSVKPLNSHPIYFYMPLEDPSLHP